VPSQTITQTILSGESPPILSGESPPIPSGESLPIGKPAVRRLVIRAARVGFRRITDALALDSHVGCEAAFHIARSAFEKTANEMRSFDAP
jgi:hypothetical protein